MASISNLFIFCLCIFGSMCNGIERDVPCDDTVPVISNFELSKYEGIWYEIFRYHNSNDVGSECATTRYTFLREQRVSVRNIEIVNNTIVKSLDGYMNLEDSESTDAKLTVDFPVDRINIPYWILDTDYETYSLVYSCQNDESSRTPKSFVSAWILSRSTLMDGISMAKINVAMEKARLSWLSMRPMTHTKEACGGASIQSLSIAALLVSIAYTVLF